MKMRETSGGKDKELCVNNKLFLNPDRITLPDVDTDLSEQKRQRVIDYVTNKYGEEYVAQIITFGSIAAKSSLRDTARVLGVPPKEVLKIGKLVPDRPGISLKAAVHESTELKNLIKGNPLYERIYSIAEKIEGLPRQTGIHACFDKETMIITSTGYKKIFDIVIGDKVLTHKNRYMPVENIIVTETDIEVEILSETMLPIKCTLNHPFWVKKPIYQCGKVVGYTNPDWITAGEIKAGDYVSSYVEVRNYGKPIANKCSDGLYWYKIAETKTYPVKNKPMYNLTVKDDHTYTANKIIVHNCGIVIGQRPIYEYCPTAMVTDDDGTRVVTSQFDGPECEEVGLVKFDFLGLRTLDVEESSLKQINPELKVPMTPDDIPIDDPKVYKFLSKGNTEGVFQFESSGMTSLLKKMFKDVKDTDSKEKGKEYFERLIAAVSLYRPGPMDEIPNYLSAMDSGVVKYDHPLLENILNSTYGVLVYQEQIMFAVRTLAGFSAGQSDSVRKAMGKKKLEIMNEYGEYFIYGSEKYDKAHPGKEKNIKGCINNGIPMGVAKTIWEKMVKFASYAFNKSHATCYAALGAKTAWLACYYPVEFMTGILNSYINNNEKLANYVSSCRQKNIKLYYPDVNRSDIKFKTVYNEGNNEKYKKGIIFGLSGINGVGTVAAREIIRERNQNGEFKSVEDFLERMADSKFNKRALEALILSGAFDSFGKTRAAYMNAFDDMMKLIKQVKKDSKKQMTLFEELNVSRYELNIKDCPEMNRVKRSTEEEKLLGCFISHPLDSYSKKLKAWENKKLYFKLAPFLDALIKSNSNKPKESRFAGIVRNKELTLTRTGKQMLKFLLDDGSGVIKCVVFGDDALKISSQIQDNSVIYLLGKTKIDDYGASCIVNQVYVFTEDDMDK